jgi:hypothetical protein
VRHDDLLVAAEVARTLERIGLQVDVRSDRGRDRTGFLRPDRTTIIRKCNAEIFINSNS